MQIADFQVQGVHYSLIKKISTSECGVVHVKSDVVSAKDFGKDSLAWLQELKSKVSGNKPVLLVVSVVPLEGINNFAFALRSVLEFRNVRLVSLEF